MSSYRPSRDSRESSFEDEETGLDRNIGVQIGKEDWKKTYFPNAFKALNPETLFDFTNDTIKLMDEVNQKPWWPQDVPCVQPISKIDDCVSLLVYLLNGPSQHPGLLVNIPSNKTLDTKGYSDEDLFILQELNWVKYSCDRFHSGGIDSDSMIWVSKKFVGLD